MSCCKQVIPANSARNFPNPAPILLKRTIAIKLTERRGGRLLELGAGCLRNSLYLLRDFQVDVLEVEGMQSRFPEQYQQFQTRGGKVITTIPKRPTYDVAIATFVIETICDPGERLKLLHSTKKALKRSGVLILSVRGPSDLVTAIAKGKRCSDGYITPSKTFARSFTSAQLQSLLKRAGLQNIHFLNKVEAPELLHCVVQR